MKAVNLVDMEKMFWFKGSALAASPCPTEIGCSLSNSHTASCHGQPPSVMNLLVVHVGDRFSSRASSPLRMGLHRTPS